MASLDAEFEKAAAKAILFSVLAGALKILDTGSNRFAAFGLTLELKENFFLSGAFCALAIYYGYGTGLLWLKLYGAGWPSTFDLFYKRYLFRRRNREKEKYDPIRAKKRVRLICVFVNLIICVIGVPFLVIYVYGIAATIPDLWRIIVRIIDHAL